MEKIQLDIKTILKSVVENNCSDLHLLANCEPSLRLDGSIKKIDMDKLTGKQVEEMCYSIITDKQKKEFEENNELDFAVDIPNTGRFRANYYMERGHMGAAFRIIPTIIPNLTDLNAPQILYEFADLEKGLLLVTGPTGSGKSTTMAAIVNEINEKHSKHIITIEDPIEFEHKNKTSIFSQREVGEDTKSFAKAIKYAMRQDPDVILVGEMRDLETIGAALTAAETGHLVIGTLHTNSAAQTVNRIINIFPEKEQDMIRTQLSMTLRGVVSQILIPKENGGRVAVQEILVNINAVANLIRENKLTQVKTQMELNQGQTKMQTQKGEIVKQVNEGNISRANAIKYAADKTEIEKAVGKL